MRNYSGREEIYTFPKTHDTACRLELMGTSYCDGSYYIERSNSETWVFEHIISGSGTLRVNDKTYFPSAGQTYIIPAFSDHVYFSDANDPWVKKWFNLSGSLIASLITSYGLGNLVLVTVPEVATVFDDAYTQCLQTPLNAHQTTALSVHRIIATLAQHQPQQTTRRTQKLHDYLATHIAEAISVEEMAGLVSLSVSQMIRLFKKEWQVTPYQFHLQCRIAAAEALLRSSSKTIREISQDLGFTDEYNFASIFKKKTGQPPGMWRR